ncbi:MAG: hypothetical protein IJI16_02680, partial [Atopobiaceae bacterium]|nr:hypothetical protein [Atopobiaceae bacterium]
VAAQQLHYIMGRDPDLRLRRRAQALATTPEKLRRLGRTLVALVPRMHSCTIGNADIIASSKLGLEVIELMG